MRVASFLAFATLPVAALFAIAGCPKSKSGDPLPSGSATSSTATPSTPSAAASSNAPKLDGGDTNVNLTHAKTATPTTRGLPMIAITSKEIRLVGSSKEPLAMPAPVSWYAGMPLTVKDNKPGMFIVPIAAWLKELRKGTERDLSVVADNAISYRIVTEVLFTAAQGGWDRFHVVALTPDEAYGEMVIEMPGFKADAGITPPWASILVMPEGVSIKTETDGIGPGCLKMGPGIAFARVNGRVDVIGLSSCLDRFTPETGNTTDIVVGGMPEMPWGEVISVIDGVRGRTSKTVVHLGLQKIPQTVPTIPGLTMPTNLPAPKPKP